MRHRNLAVLGSLARTLSWRQNRSRPHFWRSRVALGRHRLEQGGRLVAEETSRGLTWCIDLQELHLFSHLAKLDGDNGRARRGLAVEVLRGISRPGESWVENIQDLCLVFSFHGGDVILELQCCRDEGGDLLV